MLELDLGFNSALSGETLPSLADRREAMTLPVFISLNKRLFSVVLPAILSQIVLLMMETVSMIFVGRLNDSVATAGVGLGIIYVNCTTQSILTGLDNAISVLVAVAYGRGDLADCQRILHRGRILCFICYIPLFLVELMCEPALVAVGVDPDVASYAQNFSLYLYFAMGFHMQFDCYRQYLNATNQSKVVQYAVSSTLFTHFVVCYALVVELDQGVTGVAAATMVTCALNMLFVMLYSAFVSEQPVRLLPSQPSELLRVNDLKVYLSISGPSIVMLCAEWWAYEALTLMATLISV